MFVVRSLIAAVVLFGGALLAQMGLTQTGIAHAGDFSVTAFSGDGTSGVSSANTYTHAVDLRGAGGTVLGVNFAAGGTNTQAALHYTLSGAGNQYQNYQVGNNLNNGPDDPGFFHSLASDYYFSGSSTNPTETLTLTGLTTGQSYKTVFYSVGTGAPGTLFTNVTDGQGGSILYDENMAGLGNGTLLSDTFKALSNSITFTFAVVPGIGRSGIHIDSLVAAADAPVNSTTSFTSFHQFGFSNQLLVVPEPSSVALLSLGGLACSLLAIRRRARARKSAGA